MVLQHIDYINNILLSLREFQYGQDQQTTNVTIEDQIEKIKNSLNSISQEFVIYRTDQNKLKDRVARLEEQLQELNKNQNVLNQRVITLNQEVSVLKKNQSFQQQNISEIVKQELKKQQISLQLNQRNSKEVPESKSLQNKKKLVLLKQDDYEEKVKIEDREQQISGSDKSGSDRVPSSIIPHYQKSQSLSSNFQSEFSLQRLQWKKKQNQQLSLQEINSECQIPDDWQQNQEE